MLYIDNKGGVDIFNNWSIAGNTRAVSTRFAYIRELKEAGVLQIKWIKSENNSADLFTKNLDGPTYKKHNAFFCGSADAEEPANPQKRRSDGIEQMVGFPVGPNLGLSQNLKNSGTPKEFHGAQTHTEISPT